MNKIRNLIAAFATAVSLGAAALTPASAHFHFGHGGFGHFHGHFRGHDHWRFRFHEHWRVGRHCWHCGPRLGWRYHFHNRYRLAYGATVVAAPTVAACPTGFHLGYLGKHCWPNR